MHSSQRVYRTQILNRKFTLITAAFFTANDADIKNLLDVGQEHTRSGATQCSERALSLTAARHCVRHQTHQLRWQPSPDNFSAAQGGFAAACREGKFCRIFWRGIAVAKGCRAAGRGIPCRASLGDIPEVIIMPEKKYQRKLKAQQFVAIKRVRGVLRPKMGEPLFAEQTATWKAKDRAEEKRRDDFLMSIGAGTPLALEAVMQRLKKGVGRRKRKSLRLTPARRGGRPGRAGG